MNILSLSPFASYIVLQKSHNKRITKKSINILTGGITQAIKNHNINIISQDNILTPPTAGVKHTFAFHLVEERKTSWAGLNLINDSINHLVVYFFSDDFSVIYTSDSDIKLVVLGWLSNGMSSDWVMVDEAILIHAFITGNALKTLWLGGTHRSVSIKPNSKIISGDDLVDAIDPFGDSTFIAGAVRSSVAGVSLKRSSVWFGPKKDWNGFTQTAHDLLSKLQASKLQAGLETSVHHGLAQNLHCFSSVGSAYHIEFADVETLKGVRRKEKLRSLISDYQVDINNSVVNKKNVHIDIIHFLSKKSCCITIYPKFNNKKLEFEITGSYQYEFEFLIEMIKQNTDFIRIFYDTGHTIAHASLSYSTVQDRDFDIEFMNFKISNSTSFYSIKKEKPLGNPPIISDIFTAGDDSLFKWVFKEGILQLGLSAPNPSSCWLYCDDRSGEVADFIHVDKTPHKIPKITLIHVKGASSNSNSRQVSPGAYELVVAQAMKNLRRMISSTMLDAIKNTVNKYGNNRVWDQVWNIGLISSPTASSDLLIALGTITTNCSYEVIIVQPHVLKSKYIKNNQQSKTTGAMQLRSLLFGAKAMAGSASATFRVIADDR